MDPALADDNHWVNKARDLFEAQPDLDDAARSGGSPRCWPMTWGRCGCASIRSSTPCRCRTAMTIPICGTTVNRPSRRQAHARALTARGARQDAPPPTDASPPDNAPPDAAAPAELARHAYPEWDYRLGRARRTGAR